MTGITDYQEIVKVTTTNEVTQITTEEVKVIVKSYDVVQVYNEGSQTQLFPFTNITEFTATHNLGRNTTVSVVDENGVQIRVRVSQTQNTVTIYSNVSISGKLIIV